MTALQTTVPVPQFLSTRPREARGFIVPYFVTWWKDGKRATELTEGAAPDFRVVDTERWVNCVRFRWCWLCGKPLGRHLAFLIGPMCAVNHTTSEPPAHKVCAEYAARVCPFMVRPRMRRNETPLPGQDSFNPDGKGYQRAGGLEILHNPEACCIVVSRDYKVFRPHAGKAGRLINIGPFDSVDWYCEGRRATRAEVDQALAKGLPLLRQVAEEEGGGAVEAFGQYVAALGPWLPSEGP